MLRLRWLHLCLVCAIALTQLFATVAHAQVFHAPVGGRAFPLGEGRVACAPVPSGWSVENGGRALRPPSQMEALGKVVEMNVAASPSACGANASKVRLVATGKLPVLERSSVTHYVDEGRIEADGTNIDKSLVSWPLPGDLLEADTCSLSPPAPGSTRKSEHCIWSVTRALPVNPAASPVRLWPRGSLVATDAVLFDELGRRVAPASLALTPKKVQISA